MNQDHSTQRTTQKPQNTLSMCRGFSASSAGSALIVVGFAVTESARTGYEPGELSHSEHHAANAPGATGAGYPHPPHADQGAMCPVDTPYVVRSRSSARLTTWRHSAAVRRSNDAAHDALSANRGKTGDSPHAQAGST